MIVTYTHKSVSAEDGSTTLKLTENEMALSVGESRVNVSVYWRIHEL